MKKKVIVLSLGGSLIIPDKVDLKYLKEFKKTILKNTKKYKFIVACGGGSVARKYITALREIGMDQRFQSFSGIGATRMNARFMNYFFKIDPEKGIPRSKSTLKKYLKKRDVIFCGALDYKPNQTSDSTAAQLARSYKTIFINLTNVKGLYDKDPSKYKNAKFTKKISWKDFNKKANESKYQPGQHFVLDQTASKIILESEIPTYIIGKDMKQLDNVLKNKDFKGTLIKG
ncbi:UMP kinase [Candidatus Pacearchaeota archaeon]|nr:UMP kinase [Candidatus Pacearchaeota archaeon]